MQTMTRRNISTPICVSVGEVDTSDSTEKNRGLRSWKEEIDILSEEEEEDGHGGPCLLRVLVGLIFWLVESTNQRCYIMYESTCWYYTSKKCSCDFYLPLNLHFPA